MCVYVIEDKKELFETKQNSIDSNNNNIRY